MPSGEVSPAIGSLSANWIWSGREMRPSTFTVFSTLPRITPRSAGTGGSSDGPLRDHFSIALARAGSAARHTSTANARNRKPRIIPPSRPDVRHLTLYARRHARLCTIALARRDHRDAHLVGFRL